MVNKSWSVPFQAAATAIRFKWLALKPTSSIRILRAVDLMIWTEKMQHRHPTKSIPMYSCKITDSLILWIEVSSRAFRAAQPKITACIRPCRPCAIISSYHRLFSRTNSNFRWMEASLPTWWTSRLTQVFKRPVTTNKYLLEVTPMAPRTTTTLLRMMDQGALRSIWAHRVQTTCGRRRWPPRSAIRWIRLWINSIITCSKQDKILQRWTKTI